MRGFLALSVGLAASTATPVAANGRFPSTMSVTFHPTDARWIFVGTTFGLVVSEDGGQTWRWTCEQSVGYGGDYDPVYLATAAETLVATTYDGLRVSRDGGCNWAAAGGPVGSLEVSDLALGPDGTLWATTAESGQSNDVYVSRDDAGTFSSAGRSAERVWWRSVEVAPSDAQRIYVTGYELTEAGGGSVPRLFRSDNGGTSWTEIADSPGGDAVFLLVGVSPTDPDLLFGRIDGLDKDTLVRSPNGGLTWSHALSVTDKLWSFVPRADGETVVVGTVNDGVRISRDRGLSWLPAKEQPRMACAGERSDGVLFACGANWNPDKFALARSQDGEAWTKVLRFLEIEGELDCPAGSGHTQTCSALWPMVASQFGIGTADAGPGTPDGGALDAGQPRSPAGPDCGCQQYGRGAGGTLLIMLAIAVVFVRTKRRQRPAMLARR